MLDLTGKAIAANKIDGLSTLNGKLHFETDGFVFKARSASGILNTGKIMYKDICSIEKKNTLGIVPNGIVIGFGDGKYNSYVVGNRNCVFEYLRNRIDL